MTHIYLIPNIPILIFQIFHEIYVQSFEILFSLLFPVFSQMNLFALLHTFPTLQPVCICLCLIFCLTHLPCPTRSNSNSFSLMTQCRLLPFHKNLFKLKKKCNHFSQPLAAGNQQFVLCILCA